MPARTDAVEVVAACLGTVTIAEAWTTAITLNDFRSTYAVLPTFPALQEIPEHGEYTHVGPLGPAEPVRLATYGKILGFTRAAFPSDDVPGLAQLGQALAVAAAALEGNVVYNLLTSNPVMRDGQPLFSMAHANKMAPADVTAASLTLATSALAVQTGGHVLHRAPSCSCKMGGTSTRASTKAEMISAPSPSTIEAWC